MGTGGAKARTRQSQGDQEARLWREEPDGHRGSKNQNPTVAGGPFSYILTDHPLDVLDNPSGVIYRNIRLDHRPQLL